MSEISLWFPLFLIFASALIAGIVKRYTKDPCLKVFHRSFVFLKFRNGRWIAGDLNVYSNSLELEYRVPSALGDHVQRLSYVLYEHNLENIDRLLRPSPKQGTPERRAWEQEIYRLQHPSWARVLQRRVRNLFNMLRDAIAQAIVIIFGTMRKRSRFATVQVDDSRVGDMGRTLISVVSNAYEPILEKYLGREVVVETTEETKSYQQAGVLQEYSAAYLLVRDADLLQETPPDLPQDLFDRQFDVVFPRQINSVRHLAQKTAPGQAGAFDPADGALARPNQDVASKS